MNSVGGPLVMYNFMDPKLTPKVFTKCLSMENFEPSNLISESETIRARGFLAYTVTRPPIELEFEFLCPIEVSYLTLGTRVGRQRCTGIEIYMKNSTNYLSCAKLTFDAPGITICSMKYTKDNPPEFHNSENHLVFFNRGSYRLLSECNRLKIVIFRTERGSVPCLGHLKVFGRPARSCSETTRQTIDKLMGFKKEINNGQPNPTFSIPEDFLDDLTYEMMAVPMTLPSGKTIDRDTLEKHCENERVFGRRPCDPFTGLKFTDSLKPILNVALKSRIDMFVLQNSGHPRLKGVKRTLGEAIPCGKRQKKRCLVCGGCENLYKIKCEHFYCRRCLLGQKEWKCGDCGALFSQSDACKYHN